MIDIHCHLLPGIDDGPPDLKAALELARALVDDGITQVVVTPHVFPGRWDNGTSNILMEHARFVLQIQAAQIPLDLLWAGEVRLTPEVLDLLPRDELPFLGQVGAARTMLLEMPDGQIPMGAMNFVRHLLAHRVRPILVHPERNRAVMEQPERLRDLVEEGCFVQVTAGSLVGQFGSRAQTTAVALIDQGWVHAVASDAHNLGGRRPRMGDAQRWLAEHYGATTARELTVLGPAGLCQGNLQVNTRLAGAGSST